ncbi:MAG: hypothetical protein R2769_13060 [Saprospiraceae bacterium]
MIPYPNRIRDGKYEWKGNSYSFPINNAATQNSIHGFIRALDSKVIGVQLEEDYATVLQLRIDYSG